MALHPLISDGALLAGHAALTARLREYFPASHFPLHDVPARITPKRWRALLRVTPFVGLCWLGFKPEAGIGRLFRGKAQWTVFLVTRNEHAPAARQGGTPQAPGLFGMVQVGLFALHGLTVPGFGTIAVTEGGNLTSDDDDSEAAAVAGLTLELPFDAGAGLPPDALDDFLSAGVTWDFDPLGANAAEDLYAVRTP